MDVILAPWWTPAWDEHPQSSQAIPNEDDEPLPAPFLAFKAIILFVLYHATTTKDDESDDEEDISPYPFSAFEAIVSGIEWFAEWSASDDDDDDDDERALVPYLGFASIVRPFVAGVPAAATPPPVLSMDDDDAALAPYLGFAAIARAFFVPSEDQDDVVPSSFGFESYDDFLAGYVVRIIDFVLRVLRFFAAPFSPSRIPPSRAGKSSASSDIKKRTTSSEDLASLAGLRLFSGARWRSNAQARLRNAL